jgi:hypothetical protein
MSRSADAARSIRRNAAADATGEGQVRIQRLTTVLGLAACLVGPGCSSAPGEPDGPGLSAGVPAQSADIIGDVTQVERADGRLRILVEQIPTRSAGYPIAWISVNRGTDVVQRAGGAVSRGSSQNLTSGMRVQVWFTGPVAESYPVQATAGTLLMER